MTPPPTRLSRENLLDCMKPSIRELKSNPSHHCFGATGFVARRGFHHELRRANVIKCLMLGAVCLGSHGFALRWEPYPERGAWEAVGPEPVRKCSLEKRKETLT